MAHISDQRLGLVDYWQRLEQAANGTTPNPSNPTSSNPNPSNSTTNTTAAAAKSSGPKPPAGCVTRAQWAAGLQTVLGFTHVPFLQFQSDLGLPERGVTGDDGTESGWIDYMVACGVVVVWCCDGMGCVGEGERRRRVVVLLSVI